MTVSELCIIIPVYNDAENLSRLLDGLTRQEAVVMEVLVSDGGSTDGSDLVARDFFAATGLQGHLLKGAKGRAGQLNRAAAQANAEWLLFLHADSRFSSPRAIRDAIDQLVATALDDPRTPLSGRFALRFDLNARKTPFGYAFYEAKARLDRKGCIHGDQGFLLSRAFFREVGPFPEDLPLLEDNRFAETVRRGGRWLLFKDEIWTSPRRFQIEGLKERQILNALVMNFADIGWETILHALPGVYCSHDRSGRLNLLHFWEAIRQALKPLSWRQRFRLWSDTGRYVLDNAWQIAFYFDMRACYRRGSFPGEGPLPSLERYDRWGRSLIDHLPGRFIAMTLTWFWFQMRYVWMKLTRRFRRS